MATTDERTLGQLVATATEDLSNLVRGEIALAKAELKVSASAAGVGGGLFAGAAFLVILAIVLLAITAALGLEALGLPGWLSFLIVAVFLILVGGVLALIGRSWLKKVGPPRRTIQSVHDAKDMLTNRADTTHQLTATRATSTPAAGGAPSVTRSR